MNEIGNEYGTALFLLALENRTQDETAAGLSLIAAAFSENPDYAAFLKNPAVNVSERLASIDAVFSSVLPEEVLSFLLLLCEKGRLPFFDEAHKAYTALWENAKHLLPVVVRSARALSEQEKAKLNDKLETVFHSTVSVDYRIDASLLGGLVVEADGKILDGSLKRRLEDMKGVITL